ncbi:unnamed protein product [Durusdinium trenchii]
MVLGILLSPFVGTFETMSDVMIHRFGPVVGGLASALSLTGSMLWAGAQYKAILSLAASLNLFPSEFLEASVALGLLLWFVAGGLMADIWLDALSMLIVAPTMILLAYVAVNETPHAAWEAEQVHVWSVAPSLAANKFAVGLFGNLFTEELAGRILSARSPGQAKVACIIAALLFGSIGLSPAVLGIWAKSMLKHAEMDLCESQDEIIGMTVKQLLPGQFHGRDHLLVAILILESLNTVDTSILMCAKVMTNQAQRFRFTLQIPGADTASIVLALGIVIGVSRFGENVWELAEWATAAVGVPLALLCLLIPFQATDRWTAGLSAFVAQGGFLLLISQNVEMPFVWALLMGMISYGIIRMKS